MRCECPLPQTAGCMEENSHDNYNKKKKRGTKIDYSVREDEVQTRHRKWNVGICASGWSWPRARMQPKPYFHHVKRFTPEAINNTGYKLEVVFNTGEWHVGKTAFRLATCASRLY